MTNLWRLHLRALLTDWRTLLACAGVALGSAVVVAVSMLGWETGAPFRGVAALPVSPAGTTTVQVFPDIESRLPARAVSSMASVPGVSDATAVVDELTPIWSAHASTGASVVALGSAGAPATGAGSGSAAPSSTSGTSGPSGIGGLAGLAGLASLDPAPGPGVPLSITVQLARRLGVGVGDPLSLPGGQLGTAHVGSIVAAPSARAQDVAVAPSVGAAQELLDAGGTVTTAYADVNGASAERQLAHLLAGVATVGRPAPTVPTALVTVRQTLASMRLVGIGVGMVIAVVTLLLIFDSRAASIATSMIVGSSRRRLVVGFAGEGTAVGMVGAAGGLALGHVAGLVLVHRYASALLAGTGAHLHPGFVTGEIGAAIGSGLVAGVGASLLASRAIIRQNPLNLVAGSAGVLVRRRDVSLWLVPAGIVLVAVGWFVLHCFGQGALPATVGQAGLFTGLAGAVLITLAVVPHLARGLCRAIASRSPVAGLLARAEVDRLPLRSGASVVTLAVGVAVAVAFASIATLGTSTSATRVSAVEPHGYLVAAQRPWDQRQGFLTAATVHRIESVPGVASVTSEWRAILPSPTEARLIVAFDGLGARRMVAPIGAFTSPVAGHDVALSRIAAGRMHTGIGRQITLPTTTGWGTFTVIGTFDPVAVDSSAIGAWILVSPATARAFFGAVRTAVYVDTATAPSGPDAAPGTMLARAAPGLSVIDAAGWAGAAGATWGRWFSPFAATGWFIAIAGGIAVVNMLLLAVVQRRRTRAELRAIGQTQSGERRALLAQAGVLAVLAAAFGLVWSQVFVWLLAASSPAYYGFQLDWGVVAKPIGEGIVAVALLAAVAAAVAVSATGRLDVAASLAAD